MKYVFIFAGVFITLYIGAFFYVGVKKFDYSAHAHNALTPHSIHSSQVG